MRYLIFCEHRQTSARSRATSYRCALVSMFLCLLVTGCQTPLSSANSVPDSSIPVRLGPASAEGQRCVAQCQADQWRCETRQRDQLRLCKGEARLALRACEADVYDRLHNCYDRLRAIHGDAWRDHQGQCHTLANKRCYLPACHQDASCDGAFEHCFERCGGSISVQPVS